MIRLFLALFGGATCWSVQLVVSYLVIGLACRPAEPVLAPGAGIVTAVLVGVAVITALGAVGSMWLAATIWRSRPRADDATRASHRGLAFVGLLLDATFLATILVGASAILVVPVC